MSAFEKTPASSGQEEKQEEKQEQPDHQAEVREEQEEEAQVAPFITKIGAVTVTHTKPSTDPPANFEYLCQPCENPSVVSTSQQEASDDSGDDDNEKEDYVPPVERNITPKDVTQIGDDDEYIYVVGTQGKKVTRLHDIENMTKLKVKVYQ